MLFNVKLRTEVLVSLWKSKKSSTQIQNHSFNTTMDTWFSSIRIHGARQFGLFEIKQRTVDET